MPLPVAARQRSESIRPPRPLARVGVFERPSSQLSLREPEIARASSPGLSRVGARGRCIVFFRNAARIRARPRTD